jgi:uncharacterized membrane protein YgcG
VPLTIAERKHLDAAVARVARNDWYVKAANDLKTKGRASIDGFAYRTATGGWTSGGGVDIGVSGGFSGGGFSGGGGSSGGGGASGSW